MAKYVSCERIMEQADQVAFMGFRAEERKKHFMGLISSILEACPKADAAAVAVAVADYLLDSDVVPVVRCKDCKHREDGLCPMESVEQYPWFATKNDGFCSYGERREGE